MTVSFENVESELRRARMLCELQRLDDATSLLGAVIAVDPENTEAWCLLAAASLELKDFEAALRAAETAISLTPDSEFPHRLASLALRGLHRHADALERAREAVRLDTHEWRAHVCLARALTHERRDLVEARQAADRALALAPEEVDAHITAGAVALADGRRVDAEASFRRALTIEPQSSAAHNELARLQMSGRTITNAVGLAQAADGFATAVRIDPHAQVSRHNLEVVLRVFLARTTYFIFIAAFLITRVGGSPGEPGARLLPVAWLVVPAVFTWRFIGRLSAGLREYLLTLIVRDRKIRFAVSLDVLAVICLLVAAITPASIQSGLIGAGAAAGLLARLILRAEVDRGSRAPQGLDAQSTLGAPVLWLLLIGLALIGVALVVSTFTASAGVGGALVGLACIGVSAWIFQLINRR
ncbi:MAG TPA: tetratricopeptide repeat protein [Solirubrobacteraceae bacterium]|nr:tetratricopeptide repeat protein [Solirubrobacteraceae bacterium]